MKEQQKLHWPKGASKTRHHILGSRLRWTEKSKLYRIERFPEDGDPVFIILVASGSGWRVVGRRRKLKSAKTYCQTHAKQNKGKTHVRKR